MITPKHTAALGIAALAALTAFGAATPTLAGEARASGNAPVRDCPRSNCEVIGNLEDGEYYELLDCRRQSVWCLVADEDGEEWGWVRGSSLIGWSAKIEVTPFQFLVNPDGFGKL